jgi:hypothetical protein
MMLQIKYGVGRKHAQSMKTQKGSHVQNTIVGYGDVAMIVHLLIALGMKMLVMDKATHVGGQNICANVRKKV